MLLQIRLFSFNINQRKFSKKSAWNFYSSIESVILQRKTDLIYYILMKKENLQNTLPSNVAKQQIMTFIEDHRDALASMILKCDCKVAISSFNNEVSDPVALLSPKLRKKLRHKAAFRRAFEEGLLCVENGVVEYHFESKCELAYFCGRVFSNDKSQKILRHKVWVKGDYVFPATELNEFFGVTNLRQLRHNSIKNKFFDTFDEVDNLFVT